MSVIKTTGAEWKKFYGDSDYWKEFTVDDEILTVNGDRVDEYLFDETKLNDDDRVVVDGGWVDDPNSDRQYTLSAFFSKWKKSQTVTFLVIEIPNTKAKEIKALIKANGGKIK